MTVIPHPGEAHTACFDFHLDAACAGVETVLHQLLDDGSRALDDLAGCDLVDEVIVEDADNHRVAQSTSSAREARPGDASAQLDLGGGTTGAACRGEARAFGRIALK